MAFRYCLFINGPLVGVRCYIIDLKNRAERVTTPAGPRTRQSRGAFELTVGRMFTGCNWCVEAYPPTSSVTSAGSTLGVGGGTRISHSRRKNPGIAISREYLYQIRFSHHSTPNKTPPRWARSFRLFFHLQNPPAQLKMPVINGAKTQAYMQKANGLPGVYCVALNRPDAKNAVSKQLLKDLEEAVASAASNAS